MCNSLVLSLFAVLTFSGSAAASTIDIASGSLTVAGGSLVSGPGGWTSATLTYDIEYDDETGSYLYTYTLDDLEPEKAISHVIVQVSDNFAADDILDGTTSGGVLADYSSSDGNSNVGMPSEIRGIKWNPAGDLLSYTWTIETLRAPMWGNFYAIDGKTPGEEVYTFNSGFSLVGTPTEPACYLGLFYDFAACSGFALVPDSIVGPPPDAPNDPAVPEPASLVLLGSGLAGLGVATRRRKKN